MVFFNYSTMQMAAKVVYYGPGLCGKTTNLHYIYGHTAGESRGEMVSLETETDRTLFFDLLPIDVGQIAGGSVGVRVVAAATRAARHQAARAPGAGRSGFYKPSRLGQA